MRSLKGLHLLNYTDSTYKTNRFNLPLLHVIGATATNQLFSICFCFLKNEREADYAWALSRVKRCFPDQRSPRAAVTDRELALMSVIQRKFPVATNLLSTWHIQKNVTATVKKNFATEERYIAFERGWNTLIVSRTSEEFDLLWARLHAEYGHYGSTIQYLFTTWIVHKEKFVLACADRVMHYGHLVTSRAEGHQSMLKGWIAVSTGDLGRIIERVKLATAHRLEEIYDALRIQGIPLSTSREESLTTRLEQSPSSLGLRRRQHEEK